MTPVGQSVCTLCVLRRSQQIRCTASVRQARCRTLRAAFIAALSGVFVSVGVAYAISPPPDGLCEGERRLQRRALGMHAPHRRGTQRMYASGCRRLDCQQWHSDELVRKSEQRRRRTDIGP